MKLLMILLVGAYLNASITYAQVKSGKRVGYIKFYDKDWPYVFKHFKEHKSKMVRKYGIIPELKFVEPSRNARKKYRLYTKEKKWVLEN